MANFIRSPRRNGYFSELLEKLEMTQLRRFQVLEEEENDENGIGWVEMKFAFDAVGRSLCPQKFVYDDDNQTAYRNALMWLCNLKEAQAVAMHPSKQQIPMDLCKGLYIAGNAGTGKTVLMNILLNLAKGFGISASYGGDSGWVLYRTHSASEICEIFARTGDVSEIMRSRSLVIQDLGSEPMETIYMGNRQNPITQILEWRADQQGLITCATSNYSPIPGTRGEELLFERYGERVMSRFPQLFNYLPMTGEDRRKPKL